jgi:hypothetical protein
LRAVIENPAVLERECSEERPEVKKVNWSPTARNQGFADESGQISDRRLPSRPAKILTSNNGSRGDESKWSSQ